MSSVVREQPALELVTPACEKGIGKVIVMPDSKDLIAGAELSWRDQGLSFSSPADRLLGSGGRHAPGCISGLAAAIH